MVHKFEFTSDDIYNKIEEVYKTDKGKKFISHLIRSFTPYIKGQYLFDDPADISKLKCCITDYPLMSKGYAFHKLTEGSIESFKETLLIKLDSSDEDKKELQDKQQKKHDAMYSGKLLAISSTESDKYFAPLTFEVFQNWVRTKILTGDSHIGWLLKSMRKKDTLEYAKEKNIEITHREKQALNKLTNKPHKANLGDSEALQSLQEKLKQQQ